ncbi:MAG: hypothetical protein RL708_2210 [Bacteroidota bacterium]|jgi:lipid II:glycine glycyltransferase (peptidoglycan interpeptide bridge formation enzyme)
MTEKQRYISFSEQQISVFAKPWWLDASCGNENWQCLFFENKESAFAFHTKQKLFQNAAIPSILTPYQPAININETIIEAVSKFNFVELYWKNFTEHEIKLLQKYKFEISYKHTRVLPLKSLEEIYQNFKPSLKRQIKKSEENLSIEETKNIEILFNISQQVFQRQNKPLPFSFDQLQAIVEACIQHNCCKIWVAKNELQQPCAAMLMVYDNDCCYYLTGGLATEHKTTGAMNLLLWKAIQFASLQGKEFDFCGSTIPSIDKFFSTFGAVKKDVLVINKYNNRLQKWAINKWKK